MDPHKTEEGAADTAEENEDPFKYWHKLPTEMTADDVGKHWDWRDVNGESFVTDVRDQGDCGSCFTVATLGALESRVRVMTKNKHKPRLSIQHALDCNFYSEGCLGGFPTQVAKFGQEFHFVDEKCYTYRNGVDEIDLKDVTQSACKRECEPSLHESYGVADYGYIGGFYGNASELEMMKEIRARGPIMANIAVPRKLSIYRKGIFSVRGFEGKQAKLSMIQTDVSEKTIHDKDIQWEELAHSIVIVGYGERIGTMGNPVKYWIIQNSWGEVFGEKGYFKVKRGNDEISVESMPSYLIPRIPKSL